jgi:hypothetical protein
MTENRISRPFWEGGKICQLCQSADAVYPDILLCEECFSSGHPLVRILKDAWFRNREAGSVRTVSGGLPSLGKRR